MCLKHANEMANNVDPNQSALTEQSDIGQHCLLRPTVPIFRFFTVIKDIKSKGLTFLISEGANISIK